MSVQKKFTVLSITIASWIPKVSLGILLVSALIPPSLAQVKNAETVQNAKIVDQPITEDDRVTVGVKVTNKEVRPVMGLSPLDFKIFVDNQEFKFKGKDWKSPEEATPPPAWIIVLLDMSGSMKTLDSSGQTKFQGAINAINQFINTLAARKGNTKVAIVPFGEAGKQCPGYRVTNKELDKFLVAGDSKLKKYVEDLSKLEPCASTNLYEPLTKAVNFFNSDSRFFPEEKSGEPQPRLSIILLSDGYHNKPNEEKDFQQLINLLKSNPEIIVHTLGYGLTPQQLGKKYKLNRAATRQDLKTKKVPESEFVDQKRLAEIAKVSGGIGEFSGDAEAIADNLRLFLNALLGEYQITYNQPNAERGAKYQVTVQVSSVKSDPVEYRIKVFGRSLPLATRLIILFLTLVAIGLLGILPFYLWGKNLKKQAEGG